jgi:uncharacterized membrane protein
VEFFEMGAKSAILFIFALSVFAVSAEQSRFDNYRVYRFNVQNKEQSDFAKYLIDNPSGVRPNSKIYNLFNNVIVLNI